MKIGITDLVAYQPVEKVVIHSLECALYSVSVFIAGSEKVVTDKHGGALVKRSVMEVRELFEPLNVKEIVLRQQSAYDEMVGLPLKTESNELEVSLGNGLYPALKIIN